MTLSISTEDFKSTFRNHPAGVAVLTAVAGDEHAAMTVSSLFSISADPPLIGFSVSDASSTARVFNAADTVIIHMVDTDSLWLAKLGATSGVTRFEDSTQWDVLGSGERYFPGAPTIVRAAVVDRVRAGGSTLCVAHAVELVKSEADDDAMEPTPIVYHNRRWHRLNGSSALAD
ncbi:flavin reductase family protein [Streptomyces sp. 6N223]|uniref:flavin reductase family protein n=1 Tax=Streptomyces sp. 6N223 TaxID=3457412 RepID=UPI003FD2027A